MGNTLYLECYSGISGDMVVAALLDLGAEEQVLKEVLASLPLTEFETKVSRVKKSGIDACDFHVILEQDNHDHDMEYLYGHKYHHGEKHIHEGEHYHEEHHVHEEEHHHEEGHYHGETHHHEESHDHGESHHHHVHRGMKEIMEIINAGKMTETARKTAICIFDILAKAEAKAHNVSYENVHFHEVGAVDSIVDIISAAVCLDNLGITDVIVPSLYEGKGTVRCQHGILPVPVPAVVNIIQMKGLKVQIRNMEGEYVTPTGAAIVAAVKTKDELPKHFIIRKIGIGAGKRVYDGPGILRAMLIEESDNE